MTPQSVGVPNTQLILGKHSGRHALGRRCELLGFQFERPQLDAVYKKFLVLADRIKTVEDHHLLELIQETVRLPELAAKSAAAQPAGSMLIGLGGTGKAPTPAFALPQHSAGGSSERAAEPQLMSDQEVQEDYYWGV
jgi:hypothetical protein